MIAPFVKRALLIGLFAGIAVGAVACTKSVKYDEPISLITDGEETQPVSIPLSIEESSSSLPPDTTSTATGENETHTSQQKYAVAFLADGEILNVRSGPGVTHDILGSLPANAHNLLATGARETIDGVTWIELNLEVGAGWVSGAYLTEEKEAREVCNDPQIGELLDGFAQAVRDQDGDALSQWVSPIHGLSIHHNIWNPPVVLSSIQEGQAFFSSSEEYDWGFHEGSGEALRGSIKGLILPPLEDVLLRNHSRHCNTLERGVATGPTNGYVYWLYDYSAFNYIALYRAASPDQELDWRTWVAGIEYVDGRPYIVVLIQFYWEI
jgi:uncharacterized protein YraI